MLLKNRTHVARVATFLLALMATAVTGSTLFAQSGQTNRQVPKFGNRPEAPAEQKPWKFEGRLHLQQDSTEGYLVLQMDLAEGHYIYSVSPEGSPAPTKISVIPSASVKTNGVFSPDQPPLVIEKDPVFQRRIEKHTGRVQFFIPCQLDPNTDYKLTGLPVIEFNGQVCSTAGVCIPVRKQRIQATFAGYFDQQNKNVTAPTNGTGSQANAAGTPANPTR